MFIECAVSNNADYIISEDRYLLALESFNNINFNNDIYLRLMDKSFIYIVYIKTLSKISFLLFRSPAINRV